MATRVLGPTSGWAVGDTIEAFALDARRVPTGAAVATATVASNSTTSFTVPSGRYAAAKSGGPRVDFAVIPDPAGEGGGVSLGDVEDAIALHASETQDVHGISDTAHVKGVAVATPVTGSVGARPAGFASVEFVAGADPAGLSLDADTFTPTVAP